MVVWENGRQRHAVGCSAGGITVDFRVFGSQGVKQPDGTELYLANAPGYGCRSLPSSPLRRGLA